MHNRSLSAQVVILGAGPAGLSAAIQLARSGVKSVVVDENPKIGGAIFRQPQRERLPPGDSRKEEDKTRLRAKALFEEFESAREHASLLLGAEVVGALGDRDELAVLVDGKVQNLPFARLIVAAGCYERAQPFPGWTLPGVMTVGGAQLQVKSGLVKPGGRAVLAGTGPLLLVAAKQLHEAGVQIAGVFEAGRRIDLARSFPALLANPGLVMEGLAYHRYLKNAGIPFHYGWGIVEARGARELSSVVVAPYTTDWEPIRRREIVLEVDCLGVGYGYVPRTQLTQMLGCRHEHRSADGGLCPVADEWRRTSRENVYVAGDVAGVFGSETAAQDGKLAALACLKDGGTLGAAEAERLAAPLRASSTRLRKFRAAFDRFSTPRVGMLQLPTPETIVCRCENVARENVDRAVDGGVKTLAALKMATRVGMGDCQGKMCSSFCFEYLRHRTGGTSETVGESRPRFPLAPIPFSAMLSAPTDTTHNTNTQGQS